MKKYALLKNDLQHGILAMVDAGFSMSWSSSRAYLWKDPPYHYWRKDYFIVRVNSKNCPIKVKRRGTKNKDFIIA